MIRKICSFLKKDRQTKLMICEAYILLGWARIQKKFFPKVSSRFGERMSETSYHINENEIEIAKGVSYVIHLASRYTFWESECLVKAICGMKMLERRGIESTMYLGVSKNQKGLTAHAWLRTGNYYVSGSNGMENYTVVEKFAKVI